MAGYDGPLGDLSAAGLFEQLPNAALIIATDGDVVAGNARAAQLFEVDPAFDGVSVTDLLPEPERQRLNPLDWLKRWAEEPDAPELDYVYLTGRTPTGTEMQLRARVSRIESGSEFLYLVLLHDMTQAEARQRAERRGHRIAARTLAISADAVITADADQNVMSFNDSAARLFGYRAAEVLGKPLEKLIPPRFHDAHRRHISQFADESAASRLMGERAHVLGLTKNGEEIPIEVSITKVSDEHGPVFSAHVRDLRPRFAAEAAREESEARFRDVFAHSADALALLDLEGRVLEMNPAAMALLSESSFDVAGRHLAELPWWSNDPAATRANLEGAVEQCQQGETYTTRADIALGGSDETRAFDVSLRPIERANEPFLILAEARATDG